MCASDALVLSRSRKEDNSNEEKRGSGCGRLALLDLAARGDDHRKTRTATVTAHALDSLHDFLPLRHPSKDDVLTVEVRRGAHREEELRSVRVGPGVGHRQQEGLRVAYDPVLELIGELRPVDRLAAGAVPVREVPALAHKPRDDTMEARPREVQLPAGLADALLAGAKAPEVLRRLGVVPLEELHLDAAGGPTRDLHVEEDDRIVLRRRLVDRDRRPLRTAAKDEL